MANELIIPTDIQPESPSNIELLDDQTYPFRPMMGRSWAQNNSYGDPRWNLKLKFSALRQSDRARIHAIMGESQGAYRTIMVSPYQKNRGSFETTYSAELFSNYDFSSGTTGWSVPSNSAISASDGILSLRALALTAASIEVYQAVSVTINTVLINRSVILDGAQSTGLARSTYTVDGIGGTTANSRTTPGYFVAAAVPTSSGSMQYYPCSISTLQGYTAGMNVLIPFASLAIGALAASMSNLGLRSEEFDNATWTKSGSSVTANTTLSPDGTSTADSLVENSANSPHYTLQAISGIAAAAADYCFTVCVRSAGRNFVALTLEEASGTTQVAQYFNLATGAVGSTGSTGANWSNRRSFIVDMGNGWYACTLIARKTNAATTISTIISLASADGTASYLGNGTNAIALWRATFVQSSVPVRLTSSSASAVAASADAQSGSSIYLKGLPVSQSGLLLAGDWFEVDGQLKRCTAPLNSDASGIGRVQFRPKIYRAITDNTPVIVTRPVGRFKLLGNAAFDSKFGLYADYLLNLEEVYE